MRRNQPQAEHPFKKVPAPHRERRIIVVRFHFVQQRLEMDMRKLAYVLAAFATIAVAAPTVASAEGFGLRFGSDRDYYRDRDYGPRAEFYGHDRGWHHGWYNRDGDRTVIIKRHHHWDD
jgi:hypothetical protein